MDRIPFKSAFLFLVAHFSLISALAQVDVSTATLKGTITDQSGAAVSRATVEAISVARGVTRSAATDGEGVYRIPLLQPGQYELRVELDGFQTFRAQNITLTVGQVGVVDVKLAVGAMNSEITVTADVQLIETERTQQANTIERRQIENLQMSAAISLISSSSCRVWSAPTRRCRSRERASGHSAVREFRLAAAMGATIISP